MKYPDDVLSSFVTTVAGACDWAGPDFERQYGALIASGTRAEILQSIRALLGYSWSHETRVRMARALAEKQLPSMTDMMIALERDESALLRRRALKNDIEVAAAEKLLDDLEALTDKQRQKLCAMIRTYGRKRTAR